MKTPGKMKLRFMIIGYVKMTVLKDKFATLKPVPAKRNLFAGMELSRRMKNVMTVI
jgi:hypothetical protein